MKSKKAIEEYMIEVKSLLLIQTKMEKKYFKQLENQIEECCDEESIETYDALVSTFGKPVDTVGTYFQIIDNDLLVRKVNYKSFCKYVVLIIVTILVALILWNYHLINTSYENFEKAIENIEERRG